MDLCREAAVLEDLRLRVGSFAAEILPQFGRAFKDPANFRLVDELPFCLLLAIPYYGPEMTGRGGNAYPYVFDYDTLLGVSSLNNDATKTT